MRGFGGLVRTEAKVWSRDASTPFFALLFPALLMVAIAMMNPAMREPISDPEAMGAVWYGVAPIAIWFPSLLAMAIATPSLTVLPAAFGGFREKGVLRRFSATPMRPQALIGAHYVINLSAAVVGAALALVLGQVLFGLVAPRNAAIVVLAFVLGMASTFMVGTLIAARVPRGSTGSAIGSVVYFVLIILAGVWTPGPAMPDALVTVARFTPLGASAQAMTAGWFESGFPLAQTLVMVGWTAVLLPLSVKLFRWS
jgi:ABC-2 type transport system permease protein